MAPLFDRFASLFSSVRYKLLLLLLVLAPLLIVLPTALTAWGWWMESYLHQQLLHRVNTDLHVALRSFEAMQRDYLRKLEQLNADHELLHLLQDDAFSAAARRIASLPLARDFDYLRLIAHDRDPSPEGTDNLRDQARNGRAVAGVEVLSGERLARLAPELAPQAEIALQPTPNARPDDRRSETRAMVLRAVRPLRDGSGRVVGLLDGGILLNRRHAVADDLRNLVYGPDSLPRDSVGTVTLFMDDVRIATNVVDRDGERAIGSRVSRAVYDQVMIRGVPWSDRAFVVDQWYIAGYAPLQDEAGRRIGMLYAGFTEAPFRRHLYLGRISVLAGVALFALFAGMAVVRGARSVFQPLEAMTAVVAANRQGRVMRVGRIDGGREIQTLGLELDRLLNRVDSAGRENNRLALVARYTHNAVVITDAEGRVQWVNPSFERMTGYSLAESLGHKPGEFLQGADTSPEARALMNESLSARRPIQLDIVNYHKSGRPYWVNLEIQPVRDGDGRLQNFVAIESDITERVETEKQLEESRAELRRYKDLLDAALHNLPMAARVKDVENGRYVLWNRFAEQLFGVNADEALGRSDSDLFIEDQAERLAELDRKTLADNALTMDPEQRISAANGAMRFVHCRQVPVHDDSGKAIALLSLSEDITERKRIDATLRERTRELSRANAELQRASRLKDDFLANMSHELRTPLNAILALAEVLKEQSYGPVNEKQAGYLDTIESSGRHLLSLINDILDLSKIEAGSLRIQPGAVSVSMLCRDSLALVRDLARQKEIEPRLELAAEDLAIEGDALRLRQVLVNLLSNAVKFTPARREIGLRVEALGGELVFEVWDHGPGIPQADQQRLFEPFVQLDGGLTRAHEGTGLGLALVRQLTELHGGRVELLSNESGSRFRVHLPWDGRRCGNHSALARPEQELARITPEDAAQRPTVLLAEDNPANIDVLQDYLESHGYRVALAYDGEEAVNAWRRLQPPVILMDIQMPVMDGLEAIRRIRAASAPRNSWFSIGRAAESFRTHPNTVAHQPAGRSGATNRFAQAATRSSEMK